MALTALRPALDRLRAFRVDPDNPRARELRRMQRIATGLLVAMALVFLAASSIHSKAWWLGYISAFSEAAVVGACADWFAVTALFRRPFGLPIPHTAIVPRNKDRIGRGMGRFIAENFLAEPVLEEQLEKVDAAAWLAEHLNDEAKAKRLAERIAPVARDVISALSDEGLEDLVGRLIRRSAEAVPAAPVAGRVLAALRADGRTDALYDKAIELAAGWVTDNEGFIRRKVEENTARWIPDFIDRMLGDKVMAGLLSTLDEARSPGHPWRSSWDEWAGETAERLDADEELRARGEELKAQLLDSPTLQAEARGLWSDLKARWISDPDALTRGVEHLLAALGRRLADDPGAAAGLNRWIRALALRAAAPRAQEIAAFVSDVVERWDTATVVERIELQVGRDLQYIRINGTVVGGLVGVIVHAVATVV